MDIYVVSRDRNGLLKDISELLQKENLRVIGMNTMISKGDVHMRFSVEIRSTDDLNRGLKALRDIKGVLSARRA